MSQPLGMVESEASSKLTKWQVMSLFYLQTRTLQTC